MNGSQTPQDSMDAVSVAIEALQAQVAEQINENWLGEDTEMTQSLLRFTARVRGLNTS